MKKKLLLLGLGSILAVSTVAASIVVFNKNKGDNQIVGTDVEYSITMEAGDVTTSAAFESKDFVVNTDQLNNPVNFGVSNVKRNGDYFELKGSSDGFIGNKEEIFAIRNIDIYFYEDNPATLTRVEWGWKVGTVVNYTFHENIYSTYPDGYLFTFDNDLPDFFRILNDDEQDDSLLIKKIIITYGNECETQTSYGNPYKNVNKLKYKKLGDHWTVMGYARNDDPVNDLTFEAAIDELPVTEIAHHAFYYNSSVHTVDFSGSNITTVGEYSFYVCSGLTTVNFSSSNVTTIEYSAFSSCSSLTTINGLDNIENFGDSCFSGVGIASVSLGGKLRNMSGSPFYGCTSITSVRFEDDCNPDYLSSGSFNHCYNIETVYIGALMTSVPNFYLSQIKAFTVSASSETFMSDANGILYEVNSETTYRLFRIPRGTELTSYVMPDNVDSTLSEFADGCASLESVTINNKITSLASECFQDCVNLSSVTFASESKVSYLYSEAFRNCTSLTSITLPDSIRNISSDVFENCTGLTSFTIPHDIGSIGTAFGGCSNIATIYYDGTMDEWLNGSIYKYTEWYDGISATVLTCTDGTIPLADAD